MTNERLEEIKDSIDFQKDLLGDDILINEEIELYNEVVRLRDKIDKARKYIEKQNRFIEGCDINLIIDWKYVLNILKGIDKE